LSITRSCITLLRSGHQRLPGPGCRRTRRSSQYQTSPNQNTVAIPIYLPDRQQSRYTLTARTENGKSTATAPGSHGQKRRNIKSISPLRSALTAQELLKKPENRICADCHVVTHPRWASWSLGVFICIRCSGIHRGMGTHISRVKSADLDAWTDEQTEMMKKWGNRRANK
jgi:Putative GTPase activating protein for Arf